MPRVTIILPASVANGPCEFSLEVTIVNTYAQAVYTPEDLFRFTAEEILRIGDTMLVGKQGRFRQPYVLCNTLDHLPCRAGTSYYHFFKVATANLDCRDVL